MASIDELTIADEPSRWEALGFRVLGERMRVGNVSVRLTGRSSGNGIIGWSLSGVASVDLDGLPTRIAEDEPRDPSTEDAPAHAHPNGVLAFDHVVVFSPQLDRTVSALQAAGLDLRRIREEPTPAGAPRQAFFRLGEVILEVVQLPAERIAAAGGPDAPARLWGLAFLVGDIEASTHSMGPHAGEVRDAVQPGRRIATLRRSAGLAVPVALMSPEPVRAS